MKVSSLTFGLILIGYFLRNVSKRLLSKNS
ncbi:DUF760 domain-containing protein [Algoriphagus persicinus]